MNGKKSSINDKLGGNEIKYIDFLKDEIKNSGNSIQFQHLLGNLPQLDFDVRCAFGSSKVELMKFLKKHSDIFKVNEKGNVSLLKYDDSSVYKKNGTKSFSNGTEEFQKSLPSPITDGLGIVTKVFPAFGFISAKEPFKTSVYFTAKEFGDENKTLLSDFEIFVGQKLCFKAVRGLPDYEAKYRATKVWLPQQTESRPVELNYKRRKDHETGLYDAERKTDFGIIQKIFPHYGFIIVDGDEKNTVYFDKKHLQNYTNIVDLTQILKVGDEVDYCAMRSTKKNSRARWEAMQVWVKKRFEIDQRNEVQECNSVGDINDCRSGSFKSCQRKNFSNCIGSEARDGKNGANQMLKNQTGKIYPRSQGVVLKFGPKLEELVDADSSQFYLYNAKVTDIAWEFSEGDDVHFDAVKIKSTPGWKAVLVWVGEKPNVVLPTCVGDFSEFIDEDADEVETGSHTSKISGLSLSSEKSNYSSKKSCESAPVVKSSSCNKNYSKLKLTNSVSDLRMPVNYHDNVKKTSLDIHNSLSDFGEFESASENNLGRWSGSTSKASINLSEGSERSCRRFKSVKNKKSHKHSKRKPVNKKHAISGYKYESGASWGDTPYPDEEANNALPISSDKGCISSVSVNEALDLEDKFQEQDKSKIIDTDLKSVIYEKQESLLSHSAIKCDIATEKMQNVDNEDVLQSQEGNEIHAMMDNEQSPALKPYIKCFDSIDCKVQQVYCRYAVIENGSLRNTIAVFWSDFYRNGVSVEAHFDDLKEVLKPGDVVKFSGFEIVDDSGDCVQKVTMAWIGQKPEITQMTPEEYIKKEELSVTITKESSDDDVPLEKSSESMRHLNTKNEHVPPRKFLSVAYSNLEDEEQVDQDKSINNASFKESSSFPDQFPQSNSPYSFEDGLSDASTSSYDKFQLPEIISKMLRSKGLICANPEANFKAITSDIINLVMKHSNAKEFSAVNKIVHVDKSIQTEADEWTTFCIDSDDVLKKLNSSKSTHLKGTQTIITGEVIAAKVFTQIQEDFSSSNTVKFKDAF